MLITVTSSVPDIYNAQFFGASAANDESTPSDAPALGHMQAGGLVAQSAGIGGECPGVESVFDAHSASALDIREDFWDVASDYGRMDAPSYLPAGSHRTYVCGAGHRWAYSCLDGFAVRRESGISWC
ncbi:hypothetical protein [Paracidovorax avenae]|uniref:hypothetical protein n=1 Tax=Paracidovorax avenae TaxID=80867 RepID=UPI0012601D5E|nr:hypothetical protein [Paracidovorax avenae]